MEFVFAAVLLSVLSSASSIAIDCSYKISSVKHYTCIDLSLDIPENNMLLTESKAVHMSGKKDSDVKVIYFLSPKMRSLPQNVTGVFPNLKRYTVHGLDVQGKHLDRSALIKGDFRGANSLTSIIITGVNLNTIRDNVFEGADNLDFLSLEACGIVSVKPNAFKNIPKLRSLSLNYNLIQTLNSETFSPLKEIQVLMVAGNFVKELSRSHFKNLKKMETVSFVSNLLEEVDGDIVEELPGVKLFYMERNTCVNLNFGTNKTAIKDFKEKVKNCTKENSISSRSSMDLSTKLKALETENGRLRKEAKEFEGIDREDLKAFLKLTSIKRQLDDELADEPSRNNLMSPSLRKQMEFLEMLQDA